MVNEYGRENIKANIRNAEIEGMLEVFDMLHYRSNIGDNFENLTGLIFSDNNIRLAYRNVKSNKGSSTEGTDGETIDDIKEMTMSEVIDKVKNLTLSKAGYKPKAVRRVEIPKENGDLRPLGIPSIWDRLIQQCIYQVIEPICEAKFSRYSHGFRTCHSAQHAVADVNYRINKSHMYYGIKIDITKFFDNVNHSRLIKRIWSYGIRDKKLIYIIRQILKAKIKLPNGELIENTKGTPQGGIISPLLANIVLDEFDKWIERQWINNPRAIRKAREVKPGVLHKGESYKKMRKGNLKEMYHVRYADDVIIFGKNNEECRRILIACKNFLKRNLKLEISEEKSIIVNLKEKGIEFLGFIFKAVAKGKSYIARTWICEKAKARIKQKLKFMLELISHSRDPRQARKRVAEFNRKVIGFQNYYRYATMVNIDCREIGYQINNAMLIKLKSVKRKGRLDKMGRELTRSEARRFGQSKMLRFEKSSGEPLYPIAYVQCEYPKPLNRHICAFSEEGRYLIHKEIDLNELEWLTEVNMGSGDRSIEYQNNKLSCYVNQHGKCAITGREFVSPEEIHCHHKTPLKLGGTDEYSNLVCVEEKIHLLIHSTNEETIERLTKECNLDSKMIAKVNKLRSICEPSVVYATRRISKKRKT